MTYKKIKIIAYGISALIAGTAAVSAAGLEVQAVQLSDVLPAAGIGVTLSGAGTLADIQERVLTEARQDKNLTLSLSELKAFLEEQKASSRETVMAANVVKETEIAQVIALAEAEKEAAGQEASWPTEGDVLMAVASAGEADNIPASSAGVAADDAPAPDTEETQLNASEETDINAENAPAQETGNTAEISDATVSGNDTAGDFGGNQEDADAVEEKNIETTQSTTQIVAEKMGSMTEEEREFTSLVIAQVDNYVNVRSDASEDSEIVGKLYDKSVGSFLSEKDGWYEITSGNVTGYVKGEFCVTGTDAIELAKEVGTRIATVTTTTLKVREEATTESAVLGLVPIGEELVVVEEKDGFVKVDIEEGYGWVSTDYVTLRTDFVKAESRAEEEARLEKEAEERRKAQAEASANTQKISSGNKNYNSASSYIPAGGGSASGNAVAQFALQFTGNPYVYGGSSLTNGTDCSGFVMSVYRNFGVSLPHSSSADRSVGSGVGSLSEAQPGDIICYSGHVGLYIGGGQIVHASNSRTGIIVSNANYRNILAIRRIF